MQDPTKLKVWQKARRLSLDVLKEFTPERCRRVPRLRYQAVRVANAIVDTLSEGCGHQSRLELARFADMSCASAVELRGQVIRARDTETIPSDVCDDFEARIEEIRKMDLALAASVRRQHGKPNDSGR